MPEGGFEEVGRAFVEEMARQEHRRGIPGGAWFPEGMAMDARNAARALWKKWDEGVMEEATKESTEETNA